MEGALGDALSAHRGSIAKRLISFEAGNQRNIRMRCDSVWRFWSCATESAAAYATFDFSPGGRTEAGAGPVLRSFAWQRLRPCAAPSRPYSVGGYFSDGASGYVWRVGRRDDGYDRRSRFKMDCLESVRKTLRWVTCCGRCSALRAGSGGTSTTYPIAAARIPLPGSSTLSRNQVLL